MVTGRRIGGGDVIAVKMREKPVDGIRIKRAVKMTRGFEHVQHHLSVIIAIPSS